MVDFLVVFWLVWGFISALVACCGVGLLPCWFVGLLVSWSVGSLLCWFSGLLVVCLSAVWPQSPRHGGGRPAGQLDSNDNDNINDDNNYQNNYISSCPAGHAATVPWTVGPDS